MNERILPVVLSAAQTTRLNHALEHATLNVLSRQGVLARLGGIF